MCAATAVECGALPDNALDLSHTQASDPAAHSSQEAQQCCGSHTHQGFLNQKALGASLCTTPPAGIGRHTCLGIMPENLKQPMLLKLAQLELPRHVSCTAAHPIKAADIPV